MIHSNKILLASAALIVLVSIGASIVIVESRQLAARTDFQPAEERLTNGPAQWVISVSPHHSMNPKPESASITNLMNDAFETGIKMGAACILVGGNKKDIEDMIAWQRLNRPDLVKQWFDAHGQK